jgi:hypothetical protein
MRLKKAPHHAGRSVKKKNMHRLNLVAVIALLFLTSLCAFSLLGRLPLASAVGSHPSTLHGSSNPSSSSSSECAVPSPVCSDTPSLPSTPSIDCVNFANVDDAECFGGSGLDYGTPVGTPTSVGPADYNFLDGDPTCSWSIPDSAIQTFFQSKPGASFGGLTQASANETVGEDTCHGNSTCYSDNEAGNDGNNGTIHDHIGGDDITCYNSTCFNPPAQWPPNTCGHGVPYERFACEPTGVSMTPTGLNQKDPTDVYFNPSAYKPTAMIEVGWGNTHNPPSNAANSLTQLDNHHGPTCIGGKWTCPGDDPVIIDLMNGDIISNNGDTSNSGITSNPGTNSTKKSEDDVSVGYPKFWVMCGSKGAKGKAVQSCTMDPMVLKEDWLSGDKGVAPNSGNLVFTPLSETVNQENVKKLFGSMQAIGYVLLVPVCVLIGYQLFWAAFNGRVTSVQETIPRVLFSVVAIGLSYELVTMLIALFDLIDIAIVNMHVALPYPKGVLLSNVFSWGSGVGSGEHAKTPLDPTIDVDPLSFRAIVIPTVRWGCVVKDFEHLLLMKLISDIVSFVPIVGAAAQFGMGISDAIYLFQHLPEFADFLLSINLCTQLFVRIIMINYYVLMAPVAFGCWGLPAGIGERVVNQWAKGFLSLLFVQTVQLFVLTTLPLIAPEFPNLPSPFPLLDLVLQQLPSVIVLAVIVQIPKMMGGGMTKVMAQAGTVASGAVTAVGAAAYQLV